MTSLPTAAPASFVPLAAIAFSDDDKNGQAVSAARPLPVRSFHEMDLYERFAREGEPWTTFNHGSAAIAPGAVNTLVTQVTGGPSLVGKAYWLDNIVVGLGSRCVAQVSVQQDASARFSQFVNQFVSQDGGSFVLPVRRLIRPFTSLNATVMLHVRRLLDADGLASAAGRDVFGALTLNGYALTDDLNFDAEKTMLVLGDSIVNGTGPTRSANMWTFKARDHFKAQGATVRLVQMANSGSSSSEHESWRQAGRYDGLDADAVVYAVGVNDAVGAVPPTTYRANLEAFWNHAQNRWPNATVIVAGPTPVENAATHASAELLRAEAADFVADASDARLKYINLGTAFSRTDASYYASTDPAGSRVHPDDDGHAAIAAAFTAAVDAQGITLG